MICVYIWSRENQFGRHAFYEQTILGREEKTNQQTNKNTFAITIIAVLVSWTNDLSYVRQSPVNSPYKGQWRWALMFFFICTWTNGWANSRDTGDLRHYHAYYDVTVMYTADWFAVH